MATQVNPPIVLNNNASISLAGDGDMVLQTGNDTTPGAAFSFGSDGKIAVNGVDLATGPVTVLSDGAVLLQTGNDSTGPLEPFVFGGDGTINGQPIGGTPAPAVQDTGWIDATMIGTWQWYGNAPTQNHAKPGYRKIGNQVFLRGAIKNPNLSGYNNSNIFKLPPGFYPGRQVGLMVNNVDKFCSAKVQTDGFVYLIGVDATWVILDNISFLAD